MLDNYYYPKFTRTLGNQLFHLMNIARYLSETLSLDIQLKVVDLSGMYTAFSLIALVSLLLIFGLTSLKHSAMSDKTHIAHEAFAQGVNNGSTIVVPSQTGKMEITLKNSPSNEPDYSLYVQIITAIASAAAAIGGGYLASRYSHKQAMDIEILRYTQEKQKQEQIEAKQENQKEEYREKLRATAHAELNDISQNLATMADAEWWETQPELDIKNILASALELDRTELMKIPFDVRLTLFPIDVLISIQNSYYYWKVFASAAMRALKEYEKGNVTGEEYRNIVMKLAPDNIKENVDEALKLMKTYLPKNIVEMYEKKE